MNFVNRLSSTLKTKKILSSSVVLSTLVIAGCNNAKPVVIANVPTPEAASNHRAALLNLTNDNQEVFTETKAQPQPQTQTLAHLPAEMSDVTKFSSKTYGVKGSPRVATTRGVRKGGGRYQIGKPYTIRGIKYYPKLDPDLRQTGLASWYGPNFHGRLTANGEVYDQYGLSAAHPTMPLPSYAKVTNLENGSSVTVRVNDRGPFSKNRVIDLSARAAQLLGYTKQGVAKVRVEYAGKAPLHGLDEKTLLASYNPGRVDPASIPSLPGANVVLAKADVKQQASVQNQNDQRINASFSAPVPESKPVTTSVNVPRPSALVNSYADQNGNSNISAAFDFVDGVGRLNEPDTGMKNLIQLQFGPFKNDKSLEIAEKLFEGHGIIQRIPASGHDEILLVIIAEEQTGKLLEQARIADIKQYSPN